MDRRRKTEDFTETYRAYLPKLVMLVRHILRGNADEIEDVLQEVWIKGSRAWPPRNIKFARTWLGTIAINEALTRLYRAKRRPQLLAARQDGASPPEQPDSGPAPDELALWRELHLAIAALEKRSPKLIATLRLVYLEGHTYAEAARLLGIAVGTAKSNTSKAVAQLRASLNAPKAA